MPKVTLQKIGADVEGFIIGNTGKAIPSVGIFPGTKDKPFAIIDEGYYIQEDNVMPEFNIPATSHATEFAYSIQHVKKWVNHQLAVKNMGNYLTIGSMTFSPEALASDQAKRFGCEPDYCAWTRSVNRVPSENERPATLRTAGGHIHVSYSIDNVHRAEEHPDYLDVMEQLVKLQDLYLGVPSVLMDSDTERRKMYGKAGAFRPKHYGHEYRVLSSFWADSQQKSQWAFKQTQRSLDAFNNGLKISEKEGAAIQKAINTSSFPLIKHLVKHFSLELE